MSRGFYRVVFCGFAVGKNVGTLIVMVRVFARYPGDLGKSKQATMQKVRHVHGNTRVTIGLFLPKFSKNE